MKYTLTIIAALSMAACSWLPWNKVQPAVSAYPSTVITEKMESGVLTDRMVYTDSTPTMADFRARVDRLVSEGGWKVVIEPYLNSLPTDGRNGIYIATLERVRPQ